jgi:hypothetical protein
VTQADDVPQQTVTLHTTQSHITNPFSPTTRTTTVLYNSHRQLCLRRHVRISASPFYRRFVLRAEEEQNEQAMRESRGIGEMQGLLKDEFC